MGETEHISLVSRIRQEHLLSPLALIIYHCVKNTERHKMRKISHSNRKGKSKAILDYRWNDPINFKNPRIIQIKTIRQMNLVKSQCMK